MEKSAAPKPPSTTQANRSANIRRAEKNARKRAAREVARKQAAARKQRQAALWAFVAIVVVVGAVILITRLADGSGKTSAASPGAPSAAPTDLPSAAPSTPFPPLPGGANPALGTAPVVKAGTGTLTKLAVKTLIKGTGAAVKAGDSITVNYVGVTYKDGKVFDSSWSRSAAATFVIGEGQVIAGWDQGLVGVAIGSRVQLDIPQSLAYPSPSNGQPAGALRFVVDVLASAPSAGG